MRVVGLGDVTGQLSGPGRPANLDDRRPRAYCSCSRCGAGMGLFGYFCSLLSVFLSSSLALGGGAI